MSNIVTVTKKNGVVLEFNDIFGHQIGTGMIQLVEKNGHTHIINDFDTVDIILDDEQSEVFKQRLADQENAARASIIEAEIERLKNDDEVVDVTAEDYKEADEGAAVQH